MVINGISEYMRGLMDIINDAVGWRQGDEIAVHRQCVEDCQLDKLVRNCGGCIRECNGYVIISGVPAQQIINNGAVPDN